MSSRRLAATLILAAGVVGLVVGSVFLAIAFAQGAPGDAASGTGDVQKERENLSLRIGGAVLASLGLVVAFLGIVSWLNPWRT